MTKCSVCGELAVGMIGEVTFAKKSRLGMQYPVLARVRILCELIEGAIGTAWRGM